MQRYHPSKGPEPDAWLLLDEDRRLELVVAFHRQHRVRLPDLRIHATFHVIVENQLAERIAPAVEALDRLQREGLDRHEAIHAIASVLAAHIHALTTGVGTPPADANARYFAELKKLTAASWRRDAG